MGLMSPVVLIIRDGWGTNPHPDQHAYNAIELADIPFSHNLSATCPRVMLKTSGLDVGLPAGVMGNSEVGHQNIGAGRIVDQEIVRIDKALASGELRDSAVLAEAFARAKSGGALHLMGIASEIGVHGLLRHLYGLVELAKFQGAQKIFIHCFMDGRDSPPTSGVGYLQQLQKRLAEIGVGRIASVGGRYFAMDRDKRWDRVEKAYRALVGRAGSTATDPIAAVQSYYENPIDASRQGDEFVPPTMIVDDSSAPIGPIQSGDSVIFYNYRGDRPREITRAFIDEAFTGFDRGEKLDLFYATMTEYEKGLCPNVIFSKPPAMPHILGEVVSHAGHKQFRCAETEKYAHVTFFFNDYREEPFPGEERFMAPSPKEVPTYDQKPQMAASEVSAAAVKAILSGQYGLIIMNFANGDMVGHTGSLPAAIQAVEAVDKGLQAVLKAVEAVRGVAFITADHGNCEQMFDPELNGPHTSHTLYTVEGLLYGSQSLRLRPEGRLADIAPTLLDLMGLPKPAEMTGESLIVR
jgi:2,3-bisphosphoglycerate-independent phosphoglycerate mutase